MAKSITASVGRMGGVNHAPDVKVVQELLNQVPATSGGPGTKLQVTGTCGTNTIDAIQRFQLHNFGFSMADGRVDPDGPTLKKLNSFDQPGSPPKPDSRSVWGTIFAVFGNPTIVDWPPPGLTMTSEPAQAGMVMRGGMCIETPRGAGVVIQLTSGPYLIVQENSSVTTSNAKAPAAAGMIRRP